MTKSQLEAIFGAGNMNKKLELKDVSSFALDIDNCIYPGDGYFFEFHFKNNCELLLIWKGRYDSNDNIVTGQYPEYAIEISAIEGIRMASDTYRRMPYLIGRAV